MFVLAVNRSQLEHSIKSLYGAKFDARVYLQRFFDQDFRLPDPERKDVSRQPTVYDAIGSIFRRTSTARLESIGLLRFSGVTNFQLINLPKQVIATYYGRGVLLELAKDNENVLPEGRVLLTQWGLELARVVRSTAIDEFFDYVCQKWEKDSILKSRDMRIQG